MSNLAMTSRPSTPKASGPVQLRLADAVKQAQAFYGAGELAKAEHYANAIVAKHPRHLTAMQILAGVAEKRGQTTEAIEILRRSLSGASTDALPLMNLCRLYRMQRRLDEACEAGERAVAIGTLPEAYVDLGDAYSARGDFERALEAYEIAVARKPEYARAHMGLAQALLKNGDFRAGWIEYEWRYRMAATEKILPKFKQPQWNGMALKTSRLLVIAEQGYGDCIQFARYLPMVGERVKNVVVGVAPELKPIVASVPGSHICYDRWELLPSFEFQVTMSTLPMLFGTTVETIPARTPYVAADAAKTAAWRERLAASARGRKTVGVVWQGRPTHPNDAQRSIPLNELSPLLELANIQPVSLQVGDGRSQLEQHPARARVLDAAPSLSDFGDTAACVAALDCVISIDSAIAHLAGALAKPGFVMLPRVAEWRWFENRADSPWYPTLELVRQDARGAWGTVVAHLVNRLSAGS